MPPRTAGFGNRDRFELNGKIGLHRRQDNSASGMLLVAAMVANIDFPICTYELGLHSNSGQHYFLK
jgi:hypothetical protein